MAYNSTKQKSGYLRGSDASIEMMSGWDREEDLTVPTGDTDLTFGNLPSGEARSLYSCRGIINNSANAGTISYVISDDTTVRTIYLPVGGTFYPARKFVTIKGTSNGTSASMVIKLMYHDVLVAKGEGPQYAAV